MLAKERQKKIDQMLAEHGAVLVSELTERFGVSIETVRRDLLAMELEDRLVRVHGGAMVKGSLTPARTFDQRSSTQGIEKEKLSQAAMQFISEGDVISIDEGSTGLVFAGALKEHFSQLTIITHSLVAFEALCDYKDFQVILLGGNFLSRSRAFVGSLTLDALRSLHTKSSFIFPSAVSLDFGVSCHSQELMQVERAMIASSDSVFVLADSTKFEKKALHKLCDMSESITFVTDQGLSRELQILYAENGRNVIIGE